MRHDATLVATATKDAAIVVVASAMTGVTDELIAAANAAVNGQPQQASNLIHLILSPLDKYLFLINPVNYLVYHSYL